MSWIEEVKEILRERLRAGKIKVLEAQGFEDCYLVIAEVGDDIYLIGVWRGEHSFYAKITPATSSPVNWSCRGLEYNPVGLYVFAETPRELAERVAEKFPIVVNISRNISLTPA